MKFVTIFRGLSGAVKTIEIIKELVKIGPNKVCDKEALVKNCKDFFLFLLISY